MVFYQYILITWNNDKELLQWLFLHLCFHLCKCKRLKRHFDNVCIISVTPHGCSRRQTILLYATRPSPAGMGVASETSLNAGVVLVFWHDSSMYIMSSTNAIPEISW
jgi:hypothetical protein